MFPGLNFCNIFFYKCSQVEDYLQVNPFTARQTPENELAYERLMDVRLKLYVSTLKALGLVREANPTIAAFTTTALALS
jgi:hypothetical protein